MILETILKLIVQFYLLLLLNTIIKNAENRIYRDADSDDNRFYATSNLVSWK